MTKRLTQNFTLVAIFAAFTIAPASAFAEGGATPGDMPAPVVSLPGKPQVPGTKVVVKNGLAYAPAAAPEVVKQIVWAANTIRNKPYIYGGGHSGYVLDRIARVAKLDRGYDCSGSVSFALHGAGLLSSPLVSGDFPNWSAVERGKGAWVTIYANGGHVFMTVAGARFDTSGARPSRWQSAMRSGSGYAVVHPRGL
jgi:cell wall-associated NlpC family hydrolase